MHQNQKSSAKLRGNAAVRDFVEHMLNSWKDPRDRGTRWNIYFSAWFCRSTDSNESESLDFLRVLQLGMKSSCTLVLSLAPRLCLFAKLFFALGFTNTSFPILVFSVISFVLVFMPCTAQRGSARVFDTIARKNLYVVQCHRVNEFLCTRLFRVIPVKTRKSTILKTPFHHILKQLTLKIRFNSKYASMQFIKIEKDEL